MDKIHVIEKGLDSGTSFCHNKSLQTTLPLPSMARGQSFSGEVPKWKRFVKKYFLEGQQLEEEQELKLQNPDLPFVERYRKWIGFAVPVLFVHAIWWTLAFRYNIFRLFPDRWIMAATMVLGSTIGGATSDGEGAVAFPVMTLVLHIPETVARDFSFMCQSAGMASASFTILFMKVQLEWQAIFFCTIGATFSIILGLQYVDELLDGQTKQMLFVAIWFSFAIALYILNTQKKRVTFNSIPNFCAWKAMALVFTGFLGGFCSAFSGSGVDICSFCLLTLLFRVSEKIATPTSVVLMSMNTLVGFFWRQLIMTEVSDLAWEYFEVCVPVVVIAAPFGAFISSHLHRIVLAYAIYFLETLAVIGFLITFPPVHLIAIGAGIIGLGFFFFLGMCKLGERVSQLPPNSRIVEVDGKHIVEEEQRASSP